MNLKSILVTIMCAGIVVGCSNDSNSDKEDKIVVSTKIDSENNKSLVEDIDSNTEIEDSDDKNIDILKNLEDKQKKLSLINELNEEELKNANKESLQELQKIQWEKELLSEKNELQSLKNENHKEKAELMAIEEKTKKFTLISSLEDENLKYSNKELLQELQKLKWQKELLSEKFELQKIKDEKSNYEESQRRQKELEALQHKASLAEVKATQLELDISLKKSILDFNESKIASEIALLKIKKDRDDYITPALNYLDNPLSDDNQTLTISDRRIELSGVIEDEMAKRISSQINYYNNKDNHKPIFLVIDYSDGGSILAGSLIIKSIESSQAPVYVVLKSHAASMAAVIVTLADKSFAYPHATILHHEIKGFSMGFSSLTQEKEKYDEMKEAWKVFALPVAKKMGVTLEKYLELLYEHSSSGNWKEYASAAHKLKWVNNIVTKIEDKSIFVNPLHKDEKEENMDDEDLYGETINKEGKTVYYIPRLRPADMYFLNNPNGYYQIR